MAMGSLMTEMGMTEHEIRGGSGSSPSGRRM